MTGQEGDILIYKGTKHEMFSNPLEAYYKQNPPRPEFQMTKTSNWRGYIATWEIADNKLYLIGIEGNLKGGEKPSLAKLFPTAGQRVFADWVSQPINLPDGQILQYVHMGYNSIYERDIILTIEKGVLQEEKIIHNKAKKEHKWFGRSNENPMPPPSNPPKPPNL